MTNESPKIAVSHLAESDRPREKFLLKGFSALSDSELIAILLRTGTVKESVLDLSKRILSMAQNSLNRLSDMSLEQLTRVNGIGTTKAITLMVAFELARRCRVEKIATRSVIQSAEDILEYMQDKNARAKHEEFWVIYINQASQILDCELIGKGGLTSTTVDVRLILKKALTINATSFFICHNHPSGKLIPSIADKQLTTAIQSAARTLSMNLIDHIIIHDDQYYSFAEHHYLD